jgi:type II secretory pathway pseudopilin PulG
MRGFTLVELLLTAALLLGLTVFAVSTLYRSTPAMQVRAAVGQVAGDLRLAQNLAVTERTRYRLVFTVGASSYSLQKRDPASGSWVAPSGVQAPAPLPDGVTVTSLTSITDGTLTFDSLGAPYEGAAGTAPLVGGGSGGVDHIVLGSAGGGATGEVTVAPGAGRVDASW